jgi:hypothetical protein
MKSALKDPQTSQVLHFALPIIRQMQRLSSAPPVQNSDWRLRLLARVSRRELDRQIAAGAPLDESPLRALRARELSGTTERHAIAACLANVLDAAEECEADPGSRLTLDHRAVIAARRGILALTELLRSDSVLDVRGIALARRLAEDPTSPLLRMHAGQTIPQAISEIAEAL